MMKPNYLFTLVILFATACATPHHGHQSIEYDQILVAQNRIIQLHQQVDAMKKKFYRLPVKMDSPVWVKSKLNHMAEMNHTLQNRVMTDVLTQPWPDEVKRAYAVHFINDKADANTPHEYGFLQKQEYMNLEELKDLLETSEVLKNDGWPLTSKLGKHADYNAWRVAMTARTYDPPWFRTVLLPRLEKLSSKGDSSYLGYLYLKHTENSKIRRKVLFEMKNSPQPWSEAGHDLELINKFEAEVKRLIHLPRINLFPS